MIKQQCILAIRYLAIYFGYIHGMRVNSNSANGLTRFSVPLHLKPQLFERQAQQEQQKAIEKTAKSMSRNFEIETEKRVLPLLAALFFLSQFL